MIASTAPPDLIAGLATLAPRYRAVLCDVWGVVHNGVAAFAPAVDALMRYRATGGIVVLITNAPRPAWSVVEQLDRLRVDRRAYDAVVTSGDVTRDLLDRGPGTRIYHLGPDRDLSLYQGLAIELSGIDLATLVACTGLIDDETETVADYEDLFARLLRRRLAMICGNPDLVVERGNRLIPCAGALGVRYRELGGDVTLVGKPYPAIYEAAFARLAELAGAPLDRASILAIGDGAATDLRGANQAALDALFVTEGIHAKEYGHRAGAQPINAFLERSGARAVALMHHLAW